MPREPPVPVPAVDVSCLTKVFNSTRVVNDVSFVVQSGEIFGLLGPNGAGKSTVLSIILGLLAPDCGQVRAFGHDILHRTDVAGKLIGYLPQKDALYENLTLRRNLDFFARVNSVPPSLYRQKSQSLLESLGLRGHAHKRPSELSGGMRRRASLACAMIHNPPLLILDEPTSGLDPSTRRMLWAIFRDVQSEGKTILFSTHYMDEAETLCNRVGIMNMGRLAAVGQPGELKRRLVGGSHIIELDVSSISGDLLSGLLELRQNGVSFIERDSSKIRLCVEDIISSYQLISPLMSRFGARVNAVDYLPITLEDVFMRLVGQRMSSETPERLRTPQQLIVEKKTTKERSVVYADFSKKVLLGKEAISRHPKLEPVVLEVDGSSAEPGPSLSASPILGQPFIQEIGALEQLKEISPIIEVGEFCRFCGGQLQTGAITCLSCGAPTKLELAGLTISTGVGRLDDALGGGLRPGIAVLLHAVSSDPKDSLTRLFLKQGINSHALTIFVCTVPDPAIDLLSESSLLFIITCENPAAAVSGDQILRVRSLSDPSELDSALAGLLDQFREPLREARICVDVLDEILFHHGPVMARGWLLDLMSSLRAKGLTAVVFIDPSMHKPENVAAISSIFSGEIELKTYDEPAKGSTLRVKRMMASPHSRAEIPLAMVPL